MTVAIITDFKDKTLCLLFSKNLKKLFQLAFNKAYPSTQAEEPTREYTQ
jgi:hypothetical protein